MTPWKGGEGNGDVYKNGVGLGSVYGVCDRVRYRQHFLYHVDRYLGRLYGLLADAGNHSPRTVFPGAFYLIRMSICTDRNYEATTSGNVYFQIIVGRDERGGRPDLSRAD